MEGAPIQSELSLGDVIDRTFSLYGRYFLKYFAIFLAIQAAVGVTMTLVLVAFPIPTLSPNATPQQTLNFIPVFLGAQLRQEALDLTITWVFTSISMGTAIMFTSGVLQKGRAELRSSLSYTFSKLLPILAVELITGILTFLGALAFFVPGIILAIMFSLSLPVLLIEKTGVLDSLGRSRKLVGNRWLKTFGLFLVIGIIALVVVAISSFSTAPLGVLSTLVTSLVEALVLPLSAISLTVYYYSNAARLAYPQSAFAYAQAGFKFCQTCGSPLPFFYAYCSNCGAKQLH